ncbi:asparagine synthase (glutamine-hydrolyzing) [Salegentibacter sp. T436]|uniref:asparagine synthase (glutamine-hydrolyzing) n=1 Tax=Salegentibacter sp. T436 TaxID=1729720 RepID=UPI00094A3CC2|nr:asparagine synthase (glutamine-hydrolyzing) [Salegentibacter sp. T436]APS38811.1 asparagine synthetase [Salegentibacter sp. T436]
MCGIAGIISPFDRQRDLEQMLELQKHRGPDNTGKVHDIGFAYLGHNRLSIIDLNDASNQPFSDNSGRYQLSFNGEIYNYLELREELKPFYEFKTESDTEVLMAAYIKFGQDFLNKLNGMFSFAIWDTKEKSLFAARDRFGVKPFYYSKNAEEFFYASEIKSINGILRNNEPSLKVWANYFAYGSYGLPSETFYQHIFQLPAGHFLSFKNGELKIQQWYDFVENVQKVKVYNNIEEAKAKYLSLLKDSISLRFRADVEVGFNISGGLDSSLLLALVNQYQEKEKISAYTFYSDDERYDELPWVKKMISQTGNPLSKIRLDVNEVKELSRTISTIQDEPFGGFPTIAYSKIFRQSRQDNVLVLLDGQGMDEQWAGYDYYRGGGPSDTIQGQKKNFSPFKINCFSKELLKFAEKPNYPKPFDNQLQNLQYRDIFYTKIPRALRFNDRISMAASTELREPFLDYRLVEFAFAQSENFKIKGGINKYLLRELVKELVPLGISYAPKRPLQTPQREWLGDELSVWVEAQLNRIAESQYADWFDLDELQKEWLKYKEGERHSSFHIWQWVNASFLLHQ